MSNVDPNTGNAVPVGVFPDVKPPVAAPTDTATFDANVNQSTFDEAVRAAVAKEMANRDTTVSAYDTPTGPTWRAYDHHTEETYGGVVSSELIDAAKTARNGVVLAVQRSIVKDKFGSKENVWFPAPAGDGVATPIPGEHRKVYVLQDEGDGS
jgi:hypothetical protein